MSSRPPGRFVPAPLPAWELRLSYAVWIFHSLAAFVISYRVCHGPVGQWIQHWLRPSDYVEGWKQDLADSEWLFYRNTIGQLIVAYVIHSASFNLSYRVASPDGARLLQLVVGLVLHVWITSPSCIVVLYAFASMAIAISFACRSQIPAWILCVSFILVAADYVPFTKGDFSYYREFNMYLYGAIKILNICINVSKNGHRPFNSDYVIEVIHYMTYLPYSMTLIVLYEEFHEQLAAKIERQNNSTEHDSQRMAFSVRSNAIFAARLVFWALFFDGILHFIPVSGLFSSPFTLINGLNGYELSSLAYVAGQYFHVKYVVIFGVPSLFARIDGLVPPPPPICISRVSRYSRMWRHFDAGLYSFLKNHVYIPLLSNPAIPKAGRPIALIAAFLVVLAWHGTKRHYIFWVSLSAFELIIERIGILIWETDKFQEVRRRIGEVWTRRVVALSMLGTVIPGIFGVFFFLGNDGIGETIFNKVLMDGLKGIINLDISVKDSVPTAGLVFFNLIVLGYFFNNVCLEPENRERHVKSE